jgi:protein AroM
MKLAFATIGESPRDDVVPYLLNLIDQSVDVIEAGILDNLSDDAVAALYDPADEVHMVTRRRNKPPVKLSHQLVLPRMQQLVDNLNEAGADLIVILCGASWASIRSRAPLINLGSLFPHFLMGVAENQRLGVIKPSDGQVERTIDQFKEMGLEVTVTSAFPYDEARLERAERAGLWLAEQNVDMIWMSCVGMNEDMREVVRTKTGKPVILARSILGRVIAELVGTPVAKTAEIAA